MTRSRAGPSLSWTRFSSGGAARRARTMSAVMAVPLSDPDRDPGNDVVVVAGGVEDQLLRLGRPHPARRAGEDGDLSLRTGLEGVLEAAEREAPEVLIQRRGLPAATPIGGDLDRLDAASVVPGDPLHLHRLSGTEVLAHAG